MPWKEDMTGRFNSRSTTTPCAFIATSMTPLAAPKAKSAAMSSSGSGARIGSGNVASQASVDARVIAALPRRAIAAPPSGMAISAPSAIESSATPSVAWLTPSRCSTSGMWAAHVPMMAPLAAKIAATAQRARRSAGVAGMRLRRRDADQAAGCLICTCSAGRSTRRGGFGWAAPVPGSSPRVSRTSCSAIA